MPIKNSEEHYGSVTMSFHWVIALLIMGMLALGLYMTNLPIGLQKLKLYGIHKETGISILILAALWISWRFYTIKPSLPHSLPQWQKLGARLVHLALFGFMFAMPLTGWMMSSAAGVPVSFFGLFTLPDLVLANENLRIWLQTIHQWLAYCLILTILGHVGAALHHHFIYKDNILKRMLPWY